MRNLARLSQRLYNSPLLLAPEKAEVIDGVFREALGQKYEKHDPEPLALEMMVAAMPFSRVRAGYMRSDNGVALIQVLGPLVQRGAGLDAISGGFESYENLGKQVAAARADPMVRGILIEFDSPGGEANGVADLAASIRSTISTKPVVAHANEFAFSAAYRLAAAAEELYAPASGMVGSIGVIMLHVDQSRANEKRGLDVTHIHAGAHKADFSSHKPLSDEALGSAQAMVDRLYGQFVAAVAASRGVDEDTVRATEAGLLNPDDAEAAGLIDGTATLDGALARLETLMRDPTQRKQYGASKAALSSTAHIERETDMSEAAKGAAPTPAAITQADLDKARSEGIEAGKAAASAELETKAKAEADAAAKLRVRSIMECAEAKQRPALAAHLAFDSDMTAEAAQAMLAKAGVETGPNALAAALNGTNPKVGADAGDGKSGASDALPVINSTAVYASRAVRIVK